MHLRTDLQTILETILGSEAVYFQPPSTVKMTYPCVVYELSRAKTQFADDNPYIYRKRYLITIIDKDPDSPIPDKVAALSSCVFDRHFTTNNLNHDVFNIYF